MFRVVSSTFAHVDITAPFPPWEMFGRSTFMLCCFVLFVSSFIRLLIVWLCFCFHIISQQRCSFYSPKFTFSEFWRRYGTWATRNNPYITGMLHMWQTVWHILRSVITLSKHYPLRWVRKQPMINCTLYVEDAHNTTTKQEKYQEKSVIHFNAWVKLTL